MMSTFVMFFILFTLFFELSVIYGVIMNLDSDVFYENLESQESYLDISGVDCIHMCMTHEVEPGERTIRFAVYEPTEGACVCSTRFIYGEEWSPVTLELEVVNFYREEYLGESTIVRTAIDSASNMLIIPNTVGSTVDGMVSKFEINSGVAFAALVPSRVVHVSMWRRLQEDMADESEPYIYLGGVDFRVSNTGYHEVTLPPDSHIAVEEGDVLGYSYVTSTFNADMDDNSGENTWTTPNAAVSFDEVEQCQPQFYIRQSSSVPERFTVGEVLYFRIRSGSCRRYSIRASVQPTRQPRQSLTC